MYKCPFANLCILCHPPFCLDGTQVLVFVSQGPKSSNTYLPSVTQLEPVWRYRTVCLSPQHSGESPVALHHCEMPCQQNRRIASYANKSILCLSHWSMDRLARFPPFCMCLIFERPAPVTPNIFESVSTRRHVGQSLGSGSRQ
jgi:hypothetical protein